MRRIQGDNVAPGNQFKSRDTVLNEPGTIVKRQFMNDIQESDAQLIESTGDVVDTTDYDASEVGDPLQTAAAIALYSATASHCVDSGAADAYVLSAIDSIEPIRILHDGLRLRFQPVNDNTGHSTVDYNSLGVKQIRNSEGNLLIEGQITTHKIAEIIFSTSNDYFILLNEFAEFNFSQGFDNDVGSALTLGFDEDLGRISKVDFSLPDVTDDDGTPIAVTELTDEFQCDDFRIKAEFTGNDVDIEIWSQQLLDFNANIQVLTVGQIATPIAFRQGTESFIRVKKGIGEGKIGIDYQYQNPKTKQRIRQRIWVIDLDDGLAVRDYDLILPQCSASTMNGHNKLGDSVSLNWVIEAVSGTINLEGEGINIQNQSVEQIYKETILIAQLPVSKEWYSPKFSKRNTNRIRFFLKQKIAADTTTASNIKIECEL